MESLELWNLFTSIVWLNLQIMLRNLFTQASLRSIGGWLDPIDFSGLSDEILSVQAC